VRHKKAGGIRLVQKPETAVQPDMPVSAIETGCIDFILSPEDIAKEIIQIANAANQQLTQYRMIWP